jgi:ribosomal protein S27E
MIYEVVCNADDCANKDVLYRMIDPTPIITCGGCGEYLEAVATEESADE